EAAVGAVEADRVADGGGVHLGEHRAEVLHGAQAAAHAAVGHEGHRLAAQLVAGEVDGALQGGGVAVVVLGRHHHVGVGGGEARPVGIEGRGGRARPGGGQVELGEVDDVEGEVGPGGDPRGEPTGDDGGEAALARAADDERELQ